jgi:hypothetical protein
MLVWVSRRLLQQSDPFITIGLRWMTLTAIVTGQSFVRDERAVIRISVCDWATTPKQIERSVRAFVKARAMAAR